MDFLDDLSTATKAYVAIALLAAVGLLFYDCGSGSDAQRNDPAKRRVTAGESPQ